MGRTVIRQTPRELPSQNDIAAAQARAAAKNLTAIDLKVAGSRATERRQNREPNFAIHGQPRWANAAAGDFTGKHLIVFLHGYNVTTTEALDSACEFFGRLSDALSRDGVDPKGCGFLMFTWPGDTGVVYFNDAQRYAQHSGVALYELLRAVTAAGAPGSISIAAHSLGVHVALRGAAVLGIRRVDKKANFTVQRMLLLGAAVEDDAFEAVDSAVGEYHFPESAFGVDRLHFTCSRSDNVLAGAFRLNEHDQALGLNGPPTAESLVSLAKRRSALFAGETFTFREHDMSPNSSAIMNPDLAVDNHGDYWAKPIQLDYYVNYLR